MILCDREIEAALRDGRLVIDPRPTPERMDSTSVDLRLGETLDRWEFPPHNPGLGQPPPRFCPATPGVRFADIERQFTRPERIPATGYELQPAHLSTADIGPQHFILGWTIEKIYLPHTSRLCARVEGKSSLGRMGVGVHVTAPTIHAGFGHNERQPGSDRQPVTHGTRLRLEIWNVGPLPVVLMAGMRVCQLIIEEVREVPSAGYGGDFNRQGPEPKGPPPSAPSTPSTRSPRGTTKKGR